MLKNTTVLFSFYLILWCGHRSNGDFFSSIEAMEDLIEYEKDIINIVEEDSESWEDRPGLNRILNKITKLKANNLIAHVNPSQYVSHPINAYNLIKRLTIDLTEIEKILEDNLDIANETLHYIVEIKNEDFPTKNEDYNGALLALNRLQLTYDLNITMMTKGIINGVRSFSFLTAFDCVQLGLKAFKETFISRKIQAYNWLMEAEKILKTEVEKTISEAEVLEHLSYYAHQVRNFVKALDFANRWLELAPDDEKAINNHGYYKSVVNGKRIEPEPDVTGVLDNDDVAKNHRFRELLNSLCRSEKTPSIEILSKLKCRYIHRNNSFLLVAPFKVEEVFLDPDIFVFYDVITDEEIEVVKDLSRPSLSRAATGSRNPTSKKSPNRISQTAWLANRVDPIIKTIDQRAGDMTGLNMASAEQLQVANYGMGGQYEAHYDWTSWKGNNRTLTNKGGITYTGSRIATLMFYLSKVDQGGVTSFPMAKVSVKPVKGTAVLWYNLHPDGKGDVRTLHAACPVLIGSKWAANKWIHLKGQEFIRPCPADHVIYDDFAKLDDILD